MDGLANKACDMDYTVLLLLLTNLFVVVKNQIAASRFQLPALGFQKVIAPIFFSACMQINHQIKGLVAAQRRIVWPQGIDKEPLQKEKKKGQKHKQGFCST